MDRPQVPELHVQLALTRGLGRGRLSRFREERFFGAEGWAAILFAMAATTGSGPVHTKTSRAPIAAMGVISVVDNSGESM